MYQKPMCKIIFQNNNPYLGKEIVVNDIKCVVGEG